MLVPVIKVSRCWSNIGSSFRSSVKKKQYNDLIFKINYNKNAFKNAKITINHHIPLKTIPANLKPFNFYYK